MKSFALLEKHCLLIAGCAGGASQKQSEIDSRSCQLAAPDYEGNEMQSGRSALWWKRVACGMLIAFRSRVVHAFAWLARGAAPRSDTTMRHLLRYLAKASW